MKIHKISAEHLSIERIGEIVYGGYKIELSDDAHKRIVDCREYLDRKIAESTTPIYGVTTGFGSLCNVSIGSDYLAQLQINLMIAQDTVVELWFLGMSACYCQPPYRLLQQ